MTTDTSVRTAGPLLRAVHAFLTSDGWPVEDLDVEASRLATRFAGSTHEWTCTATTYEPQGQVVFDSQVPVDVPTDQQAGLATLLLHANWSMLTGAFALDPAHGAVRFRTSLVLPDAAPLGAAVCKGLVYANVLTVERCLPVLRATVDRTLGLADALESLGY